MLCIYIYYIYVYTYTYIYIYIYIYVYIMCIYMMDMPRDSSERAPTHSCILRNSFRRTTLILHMVSLLVCIYVYIYTHM